MVDLTVTAASVLKGTGASVTAGTAGASITAGQTVYLDSTTNTYKLSDCDSATAAARVCNGIALHAAGSGQPLQVLTGGPITIGATLTLGKVYCLSATAGGICPAADITTGGYLSVLGVPTSTTVLQVAIQASGVVTP